MVTRVKKTVVLQSVCTSVIVCLLSTAMRVVLATHDDTIGYCATKPKLSRLFTTGGVVFFSSTTEGPMYTFDLRTKQHRTQPSTAAVFGAHAPAQPQLAVHFDPVEQCSHAQSNMAFCDHSKVFADTVVIVGGGQMSVLAWSPNQAPPYKPFNHSAEFAAESHILPSVNSRLYASIYLLFSQATGNELVQFTGATYDQSVDALYLTATIMSDSIVSDPSWAVGKHVLFRSMFAPNGLMQDAFVVAQFGQSIKGLIDFNGQLFALTETGQIVVVFNDTVSNQTMEAFTLFGCDGLSSPLMSPLNTPNREERSMDPLGDMSNIGSIFFPRYPEQLKFVDSSLLTGSNFVVIVTVLTVLLVFIVTVDCFIVCNLNKANQEDEFDGVSRGTSLGKQHSTKGGRMPSNSPSNSSKSSQSGR